MCVFKSAGGSRGTHLSDRGHGIDPRYANITFKHNLLTSTLLSTLIIAAPTQVLFYFLDDFFLDDQQKLRINVSMINYL